MSVERPRWLLSRRYWYDLKFSLTQPLEKSTQPKESGKDKRIDILVTVNKGKSHRLWLTRIEFTMRHHFGSAKGSRRQGIRTELNEGLSDNVQWYQLKDELAKGKKFLDVRTSGEFHGWLKVDIIQHPPKRTIGTLDELIRTKPISSAATAVCVAISQSWSKQAGFICPKPDLLYSLYKNGESRRREYAKTNISILADLFMRNTKMKIQILIGGP